MAFPAAMLYKGSLTCKVYAISDVHFDHKCNEEQHHDL